MIRKLRFETARLLFLAGALALTFAGVRISPAQSNSSAQSGSKLDGKWTFNQDQSDDASKKIQDAQASARMQGTGYPGGVSPQGTDYPNGGGGGYPSGGGVGFPGGRGGMGGGPGGRTGRGQRGPLAQGNGGLSDADMEELSATPKILTVDQDDNKVTMTDDAGQSKNLYPDGKKHKEKDSDGQTTTTKTHWEGNRLITESKLGHSGKLTQTYEPSPDGKQLYVISQLENSQLSQPLVIRRVYDQESPNGK